MALWALWQVHLPQKGESQILYYRAIKVAMLAFLNGAAPQVAVEFARKFLPHHVQPTFLELEEKLNELPSPGLRRFTHG